MRLSLRRAGPGDAGRLNQLARAAYAVYVALIGRKPQPMATDWATLFDEHEVWIMAPREGEAIASLALSIKPDHVLIWSVAVAPGHQHQGIGRKLMAFAERRARALGHAELRLFTNARMERNVAIYHRLGYGEMERETRADRVVVHMAKRLRTRKAAPARRSRATGASPPGQPSRRPRR
jgi:ribosomal protein S18 acetylase RimI-like enzyme